MQFGGTSDQKFTEGIKMRCQQAFLQLCRHVINSSAMDTCIYKRLYLVLQNQDVLSSMIDLKIRSNICGIARLDGSSKMGSWAL